ncbi:hypothetical protein DPMN_181131 [Dreissena polymorpha]|uniref:Uncharacterized protein n=1 Tax=Dreissena polymorpha TaxID=45954 RepID=A0A9D4DFM7_DREPO|nr:hypothetical protein DPMN_181131 [Dreissena polymorpha]
MNYFQTHLAIIFPITIVLTRKNVPPPGAHVFQPTETMFKLVQDIIKTNLLTKFHDNRKINVASRVLTRKNAPLLAAMFQEDRTINVASRVLTRKNAPPLGSHTNLLTKFHELDNKDVDAARRMTDDEKKAITKAHHEHVVLRRANESHAYEIVD